MLLRATVLMLSWVTAISSAPAPAPANGGDGGNGFVGRAVNLIPLQPYAQNDLVNEQPLQNLTWRFIGRDLRNANATFRGVVIDSFNSMAPNATFDATFRPGVQAPIYGPDGLNGSGRAYAPSPGLVLQEGFSSRKMLQVQFNQQTFQNRFIEFQAIDVEMIFRGNASSNLLQIQNPGQLNGYLAVQMAQKGITVLPLPQNISTTSNILPVTNRMPPSDQVWVLGTVLQITGSAFFPVVTQAQNTVLMALQGLFGSQSTFLFNQIQSVWQDAKEGNDGLARFGIKTYTNKEMNSMNDIAGGDVPALMTQIAQASKVNFTVVVVSSRKLGTQAQELSGAPGFIVNSAAAAAPTPIASPAPKGRDLSGGAIAGIVVGAVAALALVLALAAFALLRRRKKESSDSSNQPASSKLMDPILDTNATSPQGSSGYTPSADSRRSASSPHTGDSNPSSRHHPLSDAWNIDPDDLAVCQHPDGTDWLLGTGSFGQVYRGVRGGVQNVAIKQLLKPGDTHLRMFEKEVELLRYLNFDRNVVQFYGASICDGNLMLVLEYMEGGDLKEALGNDSEGRLGWYGQGAHILCDIARGLHFLHSNKVAHRDLKTKNCLLNAAGEAKIADVGLAKLVGSQLLSTQLETAGTFAYAAPELLMGEPCDTRADLFSFGVICWEVVTHEIPVRGNLRGICTKVEAPQEVADLIEACLRRRPEDRPSARTIFETLSGLIPFGNRAHSSLPHAMRSGSLPPVAEGDQTSTGGSSKISLRSVERSPDTGDYTTTSGYLPESGSDPRSGSSDFHSTSPDPNTSSSGPEPRSTTSVERSSRLSTVEEYSSSTTIPSSGATSGSGAAQGSKARTDSEGEEKRRLDPVDEKASLSKVEYEQD